MRKTVLLLALLSLGRPALGQECGMSSAFMQPDGNAPRGTTAVWSDAGNSALFFIESLNVNTDGTRRSYNVNDFWGKRTAINNLCNAMTDAFAGRGWQARRALVLVFPNTRDARNPYMTTERIDADAMRRFTDWGGVARLKACAAAYAPR